LRGGDRLAEPLISGGYILLSRRLIESEIWRKPPLYLKVWIYLLSKAQSGEYKNLKRGQLWITYQEIIDECSWYMGARVERPTKAQIFNILEWMRNPCSADNAGATPKATMITTTKATKGMLISIENFNVYQDSKNYESNTESNGENNDGIRSGRNRINKNNNIYISIISNLQNEKLKQAVQDFIEFREGIKKPLDVKGAEILLKKLESIAKTDDEKIQVLEKSILKGYPDIYPLETKPVDKPVNKLWKGMDKPKSVPKGNKFHNFIESDSIDFEELARKKRERAYKKLKEKEGGTNIEN